MLWSPLLAELRYKITLYREILCVNTRCGSIPPAVVTSAPLDELVDYDENSVQSIQDNELAPTTSTSDLSQRLRSRKYEPLKRRKIDMGELMVKTNVTKRAGLGIPLSQFKAPKW